MGDFHGNGATGEGPFGAVVGRDGLVDVCALRIVSAAVWWPG